MFSDNLCGIIYWFKYIFEVDVSVNTQPQREQKPLLLLSLLKLLFFFFLIVLWNAGMSKVQHMHWIIRVFLFTGLIPVDRFTRCRSASGCVCFFFKLSVLSSCSLSLFLPKKSCKLRCMYSDAFKFFCSHFNYLSMEQILWIQTPVVKVLKDL